MLSTRRLSQCLDSSEIICDNICQLHNLCSIVLLVGACFFYFMLFRLRTLKNKDSAQLFVILITALFNIKIHLQELMH